MSRWKSPRTAAARSLREAANAESRSRDKRRAALIACAVVSTSLGLMFGDFLWIHHEAQRRRVQRSLKHAAVSATNSPSSPVASKGIYQIQVHDEPQ